jgi:hypothetical protein
MTFIHPWLLLLALAPLFWAAFVWRQTARRLPLLLKAASFSAVLAAFAEPTLTLPRTKVGAVLLVDTSASITRDDLRRASSLISDIESRRDGNWMKVVPFAGRPRPIETREVSQGVRLVSTNSPLGDSTNLEAALASSMSAVPAGRLARTRCNWPPA